MAVPTVTAEMAVVFALVGAALLLFVTERVPSDVTAIGVLVALVVLRGWTGVDAAAATAGFASSATVTIVAMYMLSAGVQRTGIVERLGVTLGRLTGGDETRLLGATVGATGLSAGLVNNTPVVAVFIPMVTGLAEEHGISPSKLLLPLSYAAMLGGTLTLVGTATNILASDLSRDLLGRSIGMFEFTKLGVVVLAVGAAYLLTVGRRLTPARIDPVSDLTETYDLEDHLTQFRVGEDSPLVGQTAAEARAALTAPEGANGDIDLLLLDRDGAAVLAAGSEEVVAPGDLLTARANRQVATAVAEPYGLRHLSRAAVSETALGEETAAGTLVEAVVVPDSRLLGETVSEAKLGAHFDTTVVAIRRGSRRYRDDLEERRLQEGDTLLLQTRPEAIDYLVEHGDLLVTTAAEEAGADADAPAGPPPLSPRTPVAMGILATVVAVAALDLLPIVIAALGGVVAMIVTDCLSPGEAYDAVSWNVVFLLAGVLPLGVAMQNTGGDAFVAGLLELSATVLPPVAVLGLFYLVTGLLANAITPVASVVLMIPVAVDTAARLGANGFAFLLAVMFAGSSAFMTPIGYQTNLMVYGPGGYRFTDYVRVGAPLQALLAVVTTAGIAVFWGVT